MTRCLYCAAPLVVDREEPINRYTRTPHRCAAQLRDERPDGSRVDLEQGA